MADRRSRFPALALTLGLIGLNLVALNLLMARWRAPRLDLTDDRRYSISPATERLLTSLDENVLIYGFFSDRTHPKLAPLVPQISDLLDEYAAVSRGKVQVAIVDPREDEQLEQEATDRYGVQSTPFRLASKYESGIVNAYFAIVVKYGDQYVRYGFDDLIEVEPLPDGDVDVRLRNLEYDLTRAIKKVVYGFRSTAELFERTPGPVKLTAIITPASLPDVLKGVPDALRKAAEELKQKGGDRFEYVELDPTKQPEAQATAEKMHVRPMTLGLLGETQFYLYGFLECGDRVEQLALASDQASAAQIREAVEHSLRRLSPGFLKTVGLVTPEPSIPPELMMQLQMQGRMPPQPPPEFEQVKQYLGRDYQVRPVTLDAAGGVPSDIDTLVVLKPRDLSPRAVYNLDQYVMRGGRTIVCAGAYDAKFDQNGLQVVPIKSGLDEWLASYGVTVQNTLLLDDRNQPLPIPEVRMTPLGMMRTWRMAPYPYLAEVREDGFEHREITSRLSAVGIYWGSPLAVDKTKVGELDVQEVLRSSARSWTSDDLTKVGYVDYEVPKEGLEARPLAVVLSGRFPSFYSGKSAPPAEGAQAPGAQASPAPSKDVVLERSPETRLAVIGDSAFLSDFVAQALGTGESGFFVENLAFTQNLIDWMNLDSDLIGIRSRAAGVRRLDHVEKKEELTIELVNYLVPLGALLTFGSFRLWRRRTSRPVVQVPVTATVRRAEG
jgi:ABC-2 type transport system permease protein